MRRVPGGALLGVYPLLAASLIVWNDFWLRPRFPGFLSGKLSGIGGCFLLPVVLVSAWEWATWLLSRLRGLRWRPATTWVMRGAAVLSASYATLMEVLPGFGGFHRTWLSAVFPFWRFRAGTPDVTDLLALVMVPLALVYLRYAERRRARLPALQPCAPLGAARSQGGRANLPGAQSPPRPVGRAAGS